MSRRERGHGELRREQQVVSLVQLTHAPGECLTRALELAIGERIEAESRFGKCEQGRIEQQALRRTHRCDRQRKGHRPQRLHDLDGIVQPQVDFFDRGAQQFEDSRVSGFHEGAWRAVKLYIANRRGQGGTTGSKQGVRNLLGRYKVLEAMEKHNIPLLGHFEAAEEDVDEFDREIVSVERDLKPMLKSFPGLSVVFEHLTDGRAADFVAQVDHDIHATVTAHHLMMSRNAMFMRDGQSGMNPGYYCKPVLKREIHRTKVRRYVTSGNIRFGAGSDSAPHTESVKSLCYGCAAGIFTAPAAVEMYTTVFDEDNALDNLEAFLSKNFLDIYRMQVSSETMVIERKPLLVPQKIGDVQVFKGGDVLPWTLVG